MEMEQEKRKLSSKIVANTAQEFPYPPHKTAEAMYMFPDYLPYATGFSFVLMLPTLLNYIGLEKVSGMKELMKVVGLSNWMIWVGWFIHVVAPMLIIVSLIVVILKVIIFGGAFPIVEYTQGTILYVFFMLYICACTTLCFFISTCTNTPNFASLIGVIVILISFSITHPIIKNNILSFPAGMSIMLLPGAAISYGYRAISYYEYGQVGSKWSNCHIAAEGEISLLNVFIMLIIDCIVYMLLALYIDVVNPGNYGIPRSVFFPFEELWKCYKRKNENLSASASRSFVLQDVEKANLPKGIQLINLGKVYGKKPVVKNLNMDIYQDQITVLLGHNGAGKSTTMGMITGMINKTSGKIIINGVEVRSRSDITKSVGLCPQDNMFFESLTVMEHLLIFATLKGQKEEESKREIQELLVKLNMEGKEKSKVSQLSGGMQRKVSLGMALVGGSQILILDEPSSGMDIESRRDLFDMLHKWRNEKTILITTHSMEEADALGDWIAIMNEGELVCFGTPMFLKKKYETGSTLILLIKKNRNVKQAVQKIEYLLRNDFNFKTAKCKGINGNETRFFLPAGNYIKLFEYLEPNKGQYDIENISFTSTTLEDVFLNPKVTQQEEETEQSRNQFETVERLENASLCLTLRALLFKRNRFIFRNSIIYIASTIIALLLVLASLFIVPNVEKSDFGGSSLKIALSAYGDTTVYGRVIDPSAKIGKIYEKLISDQNSKFELVDNVPESIIEKAHEKDLLYLQQKIIVAAEFNVSTEQKLETLDAVAMYNSYSKHSAAISFNLISDTIAKYSLGENYSISTRNHPLIILSKSVHQIGEFATIITMWFMIVPLALFFFTASLIFLPFSELSTRFTQTQFMCGVRPFIYWIHNFFFDYIFYLLFALITTVIVTLSCPIFRGADSFGVMYLILATHGLCSIPCAYLYGRLKSFGSAYINFIMYSWTLSFTGFLVFALEILFNPPKFHKVAKVLHMIFLITCPQYGLPYFGIYFGLKAIENYNYAEKIVCVGENVNPCCFGESPACDKWKSYIDVYHPDIWWTLLCAAIYFLIVVTLDCYCLKRVLNWGMSLICLRHGHEIEVESDTEAEKADHNTLRVKNLRKYYWRKRVVDNVSFSVTKGQCLGLLGVNGAGKTTTFRMLTRETGMNEGVIRINAHSVGNIEYLKRLGYCPQENALNLSLTGRDILKTMAMLRGIKDNKIVEQFLDKFGLKKVADIKCVHYSGGNKRRLTFAAAVMGLPDFILLDEPTTGVDPLSQHKCWALIKQIRDTNQNSFILTSHSLNECEAVCDDLKILKAGVIKREGPIALLKTEVCGFNVMLKLDKDKVVRGQGNFLKTVPELKNYLKKIFPTGIIRDEHSGLIHYFIKTKEIKWAQLFRTFDDLKQRCDLIDDYDISEASLEDVFVTVARTNDNEDTKVEDND
ncbi:unnamed protein product [Ceutorhynchus assimilis]|uniref:ABC transporter domain-containing protein n=1 Tax=Ceutorhynchus assimilis TaxID=467358 RepID=A0A9P0DJC1_9CUCU|nr:unnamed protein product [Ceutorhynchus assimilis]